MLDLPSISNPVHKGSRPTLTPAGKVESLFASERKAIAAVTAMVRALPSPCQGLASHRVCQSCTIHICLSHDMCATCGRLFRGCRQLQRSILWFLLAYGAACGRSQRSIPLPSSPAWASSPCLLGRCIGFLGMCSALIAAHWQHAGFILGHGACASQSVSQRQPVQQEAVPGKAVPGPAAQPGLLAHACQDEARAPSNVQPVHKAARWEGAELPEPLRARLALLHCPEPYQAVARTARLRGIDIKIRKRPYRTCAALSSSAMPETADSPLSCSMPDWPFSMAQRLILGVARLTDLQDNSASVANVRLGVVPAADLVGPVRRACCTMPFCSRHCSRLLIASKEAIRAADHCTG